MSEATGGVGERVNTAPARLRLAALWLAACRKLFGTHPSTAKALAELASANERLGHFDAALADLEEALEMLTALRGDEDRDLLPILNRIDRVCLRLGRPKDAWKYSERALKIATRTFGN
jgi:tetratricopeptide (TPR) repeat protein